MPVRSETTLVLQPLPAQRSDQVKLTLGRVRRVALIAELFGAQTGLGHLLNIASQQFDTTLVFAVIIALIILVIGVERLIFDPIERRAQRQLAILAK